MFRWLVSQFSSAETAESLDSKRSIRTLILELNAAPVDRVVRTLNEQFEHIPRQGLTASQSSRAVSELDEYAQLRLPELWEALVTDSRPQCLSDGVWNLLTSYYRKVHRGYWYCLGNYTDANRFTAQDDADTLIMASRAMTALAKYLLLLRVRYRNAPPDFWVHVNELVAWVERRGHLADPVEQYSGTGIKTTVDQELLVALLTAVAPTANLLPAQMQVLDRLLRPYAAYYSMGTTYDEQERPFAYEATRNESPRRWLKGLAVRPGVRFFGSGGAYRELCKACESAKIERSVPQWIGRTRCSFDDYLDLLQRLVAEWSQQPPSRRQRREPSTGEILVAHDLADIRRLVTFGELARSGQSLMYDTSNIHSMTNNGLRGRSEVFRDFSDEEIMLANLRSFEQSLNRDATDIWTLTDFSERGLGATAAATCAWLNVGLLVAWRRADSIDWEIAAIRRVNSTANHRFAIGMIKMPGKVHAARLCLGVGLRDYSRSIGRTDPDLEYDVLMLKDSVSSLLLPIGMIDTTCKYTLHWNKRHDIVKMDKLLDRGLNFERVEISIVDHARVA